MDNWSETFNDHGDIFVSPDAATFPLPSKVTEASHGCWQLAGESKYHNEGFYANGMGR